MPHMLPEDYAHVILACLTHDIGYVRGLFEADGEDGYVIDATGQEGHVAAWLLRCRADALPCRPVKAVCDGADGSHSLCSIRDALHTLSKAPGFRRTPADEGDDEEASIVRAADLIGQLGDPNYIRKANALFCEFEEAGMNRELGYELPSDLVDRYPQFYWNGVAPHIQTAIRYLNATSSGRQWIANLYGNVFRAEREISLSGPQQ